MSLLAALASNNDLPIAIDNSGAVVTREQFLSHISVYQSAIEAATGAITGKHLAIYFEDSHQFLTAFCAILVSGNYVVIPGNNLYGTCENLLQGSDGFCVDGFIGDFDKEFITQLGSTVVESVEVDQLSIQQTNIGIDAALISPDKPLISLYTSGSSGTPKLVEKSLRQIEAEVNTLEQLWGEGVGQSVIVGSVSHQHIYGLLFRLIWPLLSGRTIYSEILTYPEELHGVLTKLESSVLVSSPSQLSRLPESIDWKALQGKVNGVFSSGAPLNKEHSLNARKLLGVDVIEVLGSTETGGIAYKTEDGDKDSYWTALPGVQITQDQDSGAMQLISAHLPDKQLYQTTDKIELTADGNGFFLQGRNDRIVKIEGKRLSLDEMESALVKHQYIKSCRIITFTESREIVAVAATLTAKGKDFLVDKGKFKLNKQLIAFLRDSFENVLMPRKWRYVAELPINAQGKFEYERLIKLFAESEKPKFPEVIESVIDQDKVSLQIYIPNDLYYFDGHFPGTSILPGVVQLTWVAYFAKEYFQIDVVSKQLDAIKFQNVIAPGSNASLDLVYNRDKSNVAFKYFSGETKFSSGRMKLELAQTEQVELGAAE